MGWINRASRRPKRAEVQAEQLEERGLMTGGAGSLFATVPALIGAAGGTVSVPFSITSDLFTAPKGRLLVGIDVAAQRDSKAEPQITAVTDAQGEAIHPLTRGKYVASLRAKLKGKTHTSAVLATLDHLPTKPGESASFSVAVAGQNGTNGNVTVGFFLPGDADGNGTVDQADLKAIRGALGAKYGDARYQIDADANRDGRIDSTDMANARRDLGAKTLVNPNVMAKVDPTAFSDPKTRTTQSPDVAIDGTATPGAKITLEEISQQVPKVETTAGADGKFHAILHLAKGSNTFSATVSDPFGQKSSGLILPIVYAPKT